MKKTIAILFICLVGLMIISGCSPSANDSVETQDQNQDTAGIAQQSSEPANTNQVPMPPALPEE